MEWDTHTERVRYIWNEIHMEWDTLRIRIHTRNGTNIPSGMNTEWDIHRVEYIWSEIHAQWIHIRSGLHTEWNTESGIHIRNGVLTEWCTHRVDTHSE